jgi:hypothetical protein
MVKDLLLTRSQEHATYTHISAYSAENDSFVPEIVEKIASLKMAAVHNLSNFTQFGKKIVGVGFNFR